MKQTSVFLFALLLLISCAGNPTNWNDPNSIAMKVTTERDNFQKVNKYQGPPQLEGYDLGSWMKKGDSVYGFIRAWKYDKAPSSPDFQYYVEVTYNVQGSRSGWRFYDRACDSDGSPMDFVTIDRQVLNCDKYNWCKFEEVFGISFDHSYFEKHKDTGIACKVYAKNGSELVLNIPATYVEAMSEVVSK